ncbi:hypothetical protein BT96DRAFT_986725 [Gymnopus androsaceus JB14]|uniref:Uncharacterized protein n=1 Tax=Gymnopus androsaceus JB14 TaxID=1447944 RepID=A0A6A4IDR8_9AGAR|nr:hypothetical protein BT96DRAFT_986725 [Gymnopus androsaceus JB14]
MARPSKQQNQRRKKKKHCHCRADCRALIGIRQQQRHYRLVALANSQIFAPSESEDGESETGSSSHSSSDSLISDSDISMHSISLSLYDAASDTGSEPERLDSEDEPEEENIIPLHEILHDDDLPPSTEDIEAEIERMFGYDKVRQRHEARKETGLSKAELDAIKALKLYMMKMRRRTFNAMRQLFQDSLEIGSIWVVLHHVAALADINIQLVDCCINACIAYTKEYTTRELCPYCDEPRSYNGKPRNTFTYIPLIPRLQALFENQNMIE